MNFLESMSSHSAQIILSLAIILLAGFILTRITRMFHLPNVSGYILAGVVIGPYVLNLIPQTIIQGMDFVTDIALAFIAFSVGRYFKVGELKKSGKKVFIITVLEALMAAAVIIIVMIFVFHLSVPFALLLGAIGCATAPASTIMTIRQYKAKGEFVNMILQVVALDDAVALIAFSICATISQAIESGGEMSMQMIVLPIIFNILAIVLGAAMGVVLHQLIDTDRSTYHRIVLVTALVLLIAGGCSAMDISPLLACMMMGAVYVNVGGGKKIFKQVDYFTPAILLLFFARSGMSLDLGVLKVAGLIGVTYFFIRIVGKYAGAWLGAKISGASDPIRKYLGLALIPQAGVSIGLAVLGQRILPGETGNMLSAIIISSGILYEMVGPVCAKSSLFLSGTISNGDKIKAEKEENKEEKLLESASAEADAASEMALADMEDVMDMEDMAANEAKEKSKSRKEVSDKKISSAKMNKKSKKKSK